MGQSKLGNTFPIGKKIKKTNKTIYTYIYLFLSLSSRHHLRPQQHPFSLLTKPFPRIHIGPGGRVAVDDHTLGVLSPNDRRHDL